MFEYQEYVTTSFTFFGFEPTDVSPPHRDDDLRIENESSPECSNPREVWPSSPGDSEPAAMRFRYRLVSPVGFDYVNQTMERATGYQDTDYYANPALLLEVTAAADRATVRTLLNPDTATDQPLTVRWVRRSGESFVVELRPRFVQNESGEIVALDIVGAETFAAGPWNDELIRENAQLRSALDIVGDGIVILHTQRKASTEIVDFVCEYANRSATEFLHLDARDLIGSSLTSTIPRKMSSDIFEFLIEAMSAAPGTVVRRDLLTFGERFRLSAGCDGEAVVMTICRDEESTPSPMTATITEYMGRLLDDEATLNHRLNTLADGLIAGGAGFALILAQEQDRAEPITILRSAKKTEIRSALKHASAIWLQHVASQSVIAQNEPGTDSLIAVTSPPESSAQSAVPRHEMLDAIDRAHPSSLHAVSLRGASQELGIIVFGNAGDRVPLSPEELGLMQCLIQPVVNLIEKTELKDEMLDASITREEFMSTVAHEIKTPLTGIRGYGQLLERYLSRDQPEIERARRAVAGLQIQINRFLTLTNDLLDATRIHQGRLELRLETCDMEAVARDAVERARSLDTAQRHRILLDVESPVLGWCDVPRIDQVLFILISNAVNYAQEGDIRVAISHDRHWVTIDVSDQGAGIEPEDMEHLFEPFTSGNRPPGTPGGTGLGLYLARQIVRRHGGQITIRSQPNAGTTVTVRLPTQPTHLRETS